MIMNMNDVFDVKRFWKVLRIDLMDNFKIRILALVILGLMIPVFSLLTSTQYSQNVNFNSAGESIITNQVSVNFNPAGEVTILFILGLFIASTALNKPLNASHSVLTIYLLPASTFERFMSIFLVRIFGYLTLAAGIFWAGYNIVLWLNPVILHRSVTPLDADQLKNGWLLFTFIFVVIQSIYFFCGLIFKKNAMIKTTGILIVLWFVGTLIGEWFGFSSISQLKGPTTWSDTLTSSEIQVVSSVFFFGVPLFFWILSYIRLTETEGR